MSFLHPEFIYYMIVPLFILFGLLLTQKESQESFFSQEVMDKLRVSANTLTLKARNALFLLMAIFIIIALAQPVLKDGVVKIKAKSADIMIALDISDSMLATDVYPNRLKAAKQKILTLLDTAPNERIGVIAFAKNSYLVSPLSFDTSSVSFLLRQLDTDSITEKGTDFMSILNIAIKTQEKKDKKYLLILTDGGDKSDFSDEIELANKNGVKVFILAVATKKGAPIKQKEGGFIKHNGQIIISKLNENISKLATKTGGTYIQSTTSQRDIKAMFKEIMSRSDERELKSEEIPRYTQLFYYPLAMAVFLLLIATSSFGRNTAMVFVLLMAIKPLHVEAGMLDFMQLDKAKQAYEVGEYEESAKIYEEYAKQSSNGQANFNAGNAYYKQKNYKKAIESYAKATFDSDEQRALNYANLGNAYAKDSKLKKAIESYEKSLKIKEDKDTKENLEAVKKMIKKQKKKEQNKDKSDKKNKDDKNKDKKDGDKKESDENQDKSSDDKKNQDEKDSSKSKDSKDKKQNKEDMKSKKEQEENKKKSEKQEDKSENREDKLDKLKDEKDKKEQEKGSQKAQDMKKQNMSEAEEQKWIKQLNTNSRTYLYKLNDNKQENKLDPSEKPW